MDSLLGKIFQNLVYADFYNKWRSHNEDHDTILYMPWLGGCYSCSNMVQDFNIINNYKFHNKTMLGGRRGGGWVVVYYQNSQHIMLCIQEFYYGSRANQIH